ncbi:MAG: AAA family ATPase, partial [Caldimicrobium thiodismutans]
GYLKAGKPICEKIKETPEITFSEEEVIIKPELCREKEEIEKEKEAKSLEIYETVTSFAPEVLEERTQENTLEDKVSHIRLKLDVPVGQISTIARIVNFLGNKFSECKIEITINVRDGEIGVLEYQDKIKEALTQSGIKILEEEKE